MPKGTHGKPKNYFTKGFTSKGIVATFGYFVAGDNVSLQIEPCEPMLKKIKKACMYIPYESAGEVTYSMSKKIHVSMREEI